MDVPRPEVPVERIRGFLEQNLHEEVQRRALTSGAPLLPPNVGGDRGRRWGGSSLSSRRAQSPGCAARGRLSTAYGASGGSGAPLSVTTPRTLPSDHAYGEATMVILQNSTALLIQRDGTNSFSGSEFTMLRFVGSSRGKQYLCTSYDTPLV